MSILMERQNQLATFELPRRRVWSSLVSDQATPVVRVVTRHTCCMRRLVTAACSTAKWGGAPRLH